MSLLTLSCACGEAAALAGEVRVIADPQQLGGDVFGREREVGPAAVDRAAGHAVVLGGGGLLREGDAAGLLDRLQTERAVRAGPRKDDPDRARALILGQRAEEIVDGEVRATRPFHGRRHEVQHALQDGQIRVGRNDVDAPRLDRHPVLDGRHLRLAPSGEQRRQQALVLGGEVLDDDDGHRIQRERLQKGGQRFEAAGRGTDAHDEERLALVPLVRLALLTVLGLWGWRDAGRLTRIICQGDPLSCLSAHRPPCLQRPASAPQGFTRSSQCCNPNCQGHVDRPLPVSSPGATVPALTNADRPDRARSPDRELIQQSIGPGARQAGSK